MLLGKWKKIKKQWFQNKVGEWILFGSRNVLCEKILWQKPL